MRPVAGHLRSIAVVACVAAAVVFVPPAGALPGDPQIEAVAPTEGASVPSDQAGIQVTFTCPPYGLFDSGGFAFPGGVKDHGVFFSASAVLGTDGRLREDLLVARQAPPATPNTIPAGQCAARMSPPASATPGTYFWQAWRLCTGCPSGYEVGPVRSMVVTSSATLGLSWTTRAYAGFAFAATITAAGLPNGTQVEVQRRTGATWTRVATTSIVRDAAEAFVVLPVGPQQLRVAGTLGTATVLSAERSVRVVRPLRWTTRPADDGRYRGNSAGASSVKFRIASRGRQVRGFSAFVTMTCPGISAGQFTVQVGTAIVPRVAIAPDGNFLASRVVGNDTAITLRGRFVAGQVRDGRVTLSLGTCSGQQAFTARNARS